MGQCDKWLRVQQIPFSVNVNKKILKKQGCGNKSMVADAINDKGINFLLAR